MVSMAKNKLVQNSKKNSDLFAKTAFEEPLRKKDRERIKKREIECIAAYELKLRKSNEEKKKQRLKLRKSIEKYDEFKDIEFGETNEAFNTLRKLNKLRIPAALAPNKMKEAATKRDTKWLQDRLRHFKYSRDEDLNCNLGETDVNVLSGEVQRLLVKHKIFDENNKNQTKNEYLMKLTKRKWDLRELID